MVRGGRGRCARCAKEKVFLEAGNGKHYFCDSGPAGEAAGLRRKRGAHFLSIKHRTGAGPDGNGDRTAAIAGLKADPTVERAERDRYPRFSGPTGSRGED